MAMPVVINDASNILVKGNTFPGWNTGADRVAVDVNTTSGVTVDPP
jgi:hypothetical protein